MSSTTASLINPIEFYRVSRLKQLRRLFYLVSPIPCFKSIIFTERDCQIMKKVLIITYYWPPSGGAGVQRWLKFAKYLPEIGWQPIILTVGPTSASYPQRDESLSKEVASDCLVYTTQSFELYNLYKLVSDKKEVPSRGFANESKDGLFQKFSKFLRGNFL